MTTAKTKTRKQTEAGTERREPTPAELQRAQEIHSLAQLVFAQLPPDYSMAPQQFVPTGMQVPPWGTPQTSTPPQAWPVTEPWFA